ncbi:imidazole glycerol phosphate synthase [Paucilactobacillus hokkaidonensis JCM 18461]|uniref:Imidazole glycerol phosphate synthase subunit HisF n=2 Tax=Paucilactobacillus hokkaidonensis TaxID=1193095 RepID=A0A0A1GX83_9LACO|nr:imidazole glycerol phosphate synthase subunit HisF [Paucilactobacillus hokkaidonensis]KRO09407.1 imidazole glycerol phosphate synthase subunit HisF [Paucilactobacillus hokkaidonensis]BAP86655.1 imidazole glycerol phosphate synthase [Paucilactobacillus hokkaidonensis JCM 18461]
MLAKRIIPCLDVDNGRVKKGVKFVDLKDVGDPVAIAKAYQEQGADELVFLDITATNQNRETMTNVIERVSAQIFMPLTVGGGIRSVADINNMLLAGADKVSLNSAAVANPKLIQQGAEKFGRQCIVVAIDTRWNQKTNQYDVMVNGGRKNTGLDALEWARRVQQLGAGELLITSMDADGTKIGFDLRLYQQMDQQVSIPVIASGGCGQVSDFSALFEQTNVDAALAASVFHYGELTIEQVKHQLTLQGVAVR